MRAPLPATGGPAPDNHLGPDRARHGEKSERSILKGDMPSALLDRYLIERDRQGRPQAFFRDPRATEPAFRDHGRRLSTPHAYPDTIGDMLKVARHRGWTRLRVEGDEAFRRDVWIQARAQGLEVSGYRPRERDRQAAGETSPALNTARAPTVDLDRRLKMAAGVVRKLVSDPEARHRLLNRAAALVSLRRDREPSERSRPRNTDRSR
ncbi:LPD7 domain-containing protein [Brevundimonas faecalis]|uniref:Large polyvalent protein-associated domain-containing protein n=1 Tax=Brevundimonas faecalis TaxID=947378 RepID=A0ABV2R7S8_9CAUL